MNRSESPSEKIAGWRRRPVLPPIVVPKGWTVRFARFDNGYPALDYLDNVCSDPGRPVGHGEFVDFAGCIKRIQTDGGQHHGMPISKWRYFDEPWECDHDMGEWKHGEHRVLWFLRPGRTLVVTNGFRKPGKSTPRGVTEHGLAILRWDIEKNGGPRKPEDQQKKSRKMGRGGR